MLAFVRDGDTVVVHSMDRLARNLDDLRQRMITSTKTLQEKEAEQETLEDKLDELTVQIAEKSKNAQEAHECIRPTDMARRPETVARFLDREQLALYDLIWKRSIASRRRLRTR